MVISKLQGGLGNQMFQYAMARSVSNGRIIYLDLSFLNNNTQSTDSFTARDYELSIFNGIRTKILNPLLSHVIIKGDISNRILRKIFLPGIKIIQDNNAGDHLCNFDKSSLYFDGYFQNHKFFQRIRATLLIDFDFPELKGKSKVWFNEISKVTNSVSIHVRRGDYLNISNSSYHGVLPLSYYLKAVDIIDQNVQNASFYIFSDDTNWCKKNFNFLGPKAKLIETSDESWEDMALMSKCSHHIIANSSFSWWAAWLSPTTTKNVIAPKNWFAEISKIKEADCLIPEDWIKI